MAPSSFATAVVAHAAASAAAVVHCSHLLKPETTLAAAVARLLSPATPSATGLVLLGNVGVSALLLLVVALKAVFLGPLSALEAQNASEAAVSWLLFKVVTLAALEAEPDASELLAWGTFFAWLGVCRVFVGLAKDRFERLSAAPSTTRKQHARTLALLSLLLCADVACIRLVMRVFRDAGGITVWLLLHDAVTVALQTLLLAVRYAAHLYEVWLFCTAGALPSGERRRSILFCIDFAVEACIDVMSLCHSALLYWLHGMSLQLVDAIILLHLRALALSFRHRVSRFVSFLAVSRDLQRMYADVSAEELAARQDDCAVCRERLDKAKRLPCGHLFHSQCLQARPCVGTRLSRRLQLTRQRRCLRPRAALAGVQGGMPHVPCAAAKLAALVARSAPRRNCCCTTCSVACFWRGSRSALMQPPHPRVVHTRARLRSGRKTAASLDTRCSACQVTSNALLPRHACRCARALVSSDSSAHALETWCWPMLSRRSATRCACVPSAAPRSCAKLRM
jgi:hypothetical protein